MDPRWRIVPKIIAPSAENGIDHAGTATILAQAGSRVVEWRKGGKYWSSIATYSYGGTTCCLRDRERGLGFATLGAKTLFEGGRFHWKRITPEHVEKMAAFLGVPVEGFPVLDAKRTVTWEGEINQPPPEMHEQTPLPPEPPGDAEEDDDLVYLTKRLCCDLANDAASLENGSITQATVTHRLYGYAEEIAEALEYEGPDTLKKWLARQQKKT